MSSSIRAHTRLRQSTPSQEIGPGVHDPEAASQHAHPGAVPSEPYRLTGIVFEHAASHEDETHSDIAGSESKADSSLEDRQHVAAAIARKLHFDPEGFAAALAQGEPPSIAPFLACIPESADETEALRQLLQHAVLPHIAMLPAAKLSRASLIDGRRRWACGRR